MEINYALIGKRIRETRKQRGLSAEELAEIADLSTVYISYIENAKRKPSLESLIKISNALEITIDELHKYVYGKTVKAAKKRNNKQHPMTFGDFDKGLFGIFGKLTKGVAMNEAEKAIEEELEKLKTIAVSETELTKIKNKMESTLAFSKMETLSNATNLAMYELLGNANIINEEESRYASVTSDQVLEQANLVFDKNNCSTLYYLSND